MMVQLQVQDGVVDVKHLDEVIVVPDPVPDGRHVGDGEERGREWSDIGVRH